MHHLQQQQQQHQQRQRQQQRRRQRLQQDWHPQVEVHPKEQQQQQQQQQQQDDCQSAKERKTSPQTAISATMSITTKSTTATKRTQTRAVTIPSQSRLRTTTAAAVLGYAVLLLCLSLSQSQVIIARDYPLPAFSMILMVKDDDLDVSAFQDSLEHVLEVHMTEYFSALGTSTSSEPPVVSDTTNNSIISHETFNEVQLSTKIRRTFLGMTADDVPHSQIHAAFSGDISLLFFDKEPNATLVDAIITEQLKRSFQGDTYWRLLQRFYYDDQLNIIDDVGIMIGTELVLTQTTNQQNANGKTNSNRRHPRAGLTVTGVVLVIFMVLLVSFATLALLTFFNYRKLKRRDEEETGGHEHAGLMRGSERGGDTLSKVRALGKRAISHILYGGGRSSSNHSLGDAESSSVASSAVSNESYPGDEQQQHKREEESWLDEWTRAITSIPLRNPDKIQTKPLPRPAKRQSRKVFLCNITEGMGEGEEEDEEEEESGQRSSNQPSSQQQQQKQQQDDDFGGSSTGLGDPLKAEPIRGLGGDSDEDTRKDPLRSQKNGSKKNNVRTRTNGIEVELAPPTTKQNTLRRYRDEEAPPPPSLSSKSLLSA